MKCKPAVLLAALLGVASVPALAETLSASASLQLKKIQLIDLDPNDGIQPYFYFTSYAARANQQMWVNTGPDAARNLSGFSNNSAPSWSNVITFQGQTNSVSFVNNALPLLQASSSLIPGAKNNTDIQLERSFVLSPHTMILFYADSRLAASREQLWGPGYPGSSSGIRVEAPSQPGSSQVMVNNSFAWLSPQDLHIEESERMKVAFSNTSATANQGIFSMYLNSSVENAFQYPSNPIPEPETWSMLLAGLGLCGWAMRRRAGTQA